MLVKSQSQLPEETEEAPLSISVTAEEASTPRPRLRPLDEAAVHLSNALQTDELRQAAGELATEYKELRESVVADLQRAGTKITEAILDARRGIAPAIGGLAGDIVTSQVEKAAGFADRIVAGRTENSVEASPQR